MNQNNVDNTKGWICPKCGKVNAPWKSSCDCINQYTPRPYFYWEYDPHIHFPQYTVTWCSSG